jgi:Protein of unknown function (DUF1420)
MTKDPRQFLRLQDVVFPAPLPALLSLLIVAGIAYLGWQLASRLRRGSPELLDVAAGFVVSAAALAALVHALALAQLSTIAVLRPVGLALAAVGVLAVVRQGAPSVAAFRRELAGLAGTPRWEQAVTVVTAAVILGLGAAALAPVTDADSIGYHLAVPLDWVRHGGAYPRPDWFASRLLGLAEALNLLGLATGTDGLGAAVQFGGLISAAVALGALAPTARDRRVAWLLAVCFPVAAFLVPNQKPQMLPAAATTIALVLAVRRFETFGVADAILAFGCAAFALSSKISFLLTAGIAIFVGLLAAKKSGHLRVALGIAGLAVGAIWVPLLLRNYVFFGDPISPFLERFRPHPDPAITGFAAYLRDMNGERTAASLLRFPLAILGTTNPAALTLPLGLGALAFIPAMRTKGRARMLLWAALAAFVICIVLGQIAPRFFLEPYLWAGAALGAASWGRVKRIVVGAIFIQGCLSAAIALVGAVTLFPGAWTPRLRDAVMTRAATGYESGKWLDRVLSPAAVIIEPQGRFQLFSPRPFVLTDQVTKLPPNDGERGLAQFVGDHGINTIVIDGSPPEDDLFLRLAKRCGTPVGPPQVLPQATRNPLNRAQYESQAFALRDDCFVPRPAL